MLTILKLLVKWYGAEALARLIIGTFMEGYHLHKSPKKRISDEAMETRIEA